MNIRGVANSVYKSKTGLNLRRRLFNMLPNMTINNSARCNTLGTIISRPDVNRAIMGATAILTQPFIDYNNHKVDQETAAVSTCRTIGKIVAGTAVGVAVRSACLAVTNACTSIESNAPAWKKWLMPSQNVEKYISKRNVDWFKNYKNTLGTILGISAMLFTNVLLDVPLTNLISKGLNNLRKKYSQTDNNNQNERKVAK